MFSVILAIVSLIAAVVLPQFIPDQVPKGGRVVARLVLGVFALFLVLSTSFLFVGEEETGHMFKIYLGSSLKDGDIIATDGEKGPQADILPPGFHPWLFVNVIYTIRNFPVVNIPAGKYGYLVAKDGAPLGEGHTYADAFEPGQVKKMVSDARTFLTRGGQKGPQTTVLTPGKYRLNHYLWEVQLGDSTEIQKGFVGVIKSNVHTSVNFGNLIVEKPKICAPTRRTAEEGGELSVPLVPVGCIGVWDRALNPGKYYINQRAFTVTRLDTRVQTWEYRGGYIKRSINLVVDHKGKITQEPRSEKIPVPKGAEKAVFIKVEGWDVPLELRALVQVTPKNAPFVIASVGGLKEVRNRILTPAIRAVVRNVVGGTIRVPTPVLGEDKKPVLDEKTGRPKMVVVTRMTRVLDLIENRSVLEDNVEVTIRREGLKGGVDIREVRFGEPAIPPTLLVTRQREQLASQLAKAYQEERRAQEQRVKSEQARATADQQDSLVRAQIEVKRSEQYAIARKNEGQGERDKLALIAEGQKSQAQVLGEDRVANLRKFEILIDRLFGFLEKNPEVLTTALANAHKFVPERVFTLGGSGGGSSLLGAAAILGDLLGGGKNPTSYGPISRGPVKPPSTASVGASHVRVKLPEGAVVLDEARKRMIARIRRGLVVEKLSEEEGDWVKVRLRDGREGWVRGFQLEDSPPTR